MDEPELYEEYERQEVVAFFGPQDGARSVCDGQWVLFPQVAICMALLGAGPTQSHFRAATKFFWVAGRPYQVGRDGRYPTFVPNEVVGGGAAGQAIHLFVRTASTSKYRYLGELAPSCVQQWGSTMNCGEAHFDLRPALPSALWIELGGLEPGPVDPSAVDASLDKLHSPTTAESRFQILQQLVQYWHGPIRPEDGMGEDELQGLVMPMPLRWWYRWAGRRSEIMTGQNILFKPRDEDHPYWQLMVKDGYLLFYSENQGVYQWATLPEGTDPPVFGRYEAGDPWEQEETRLSEHLILACIFEAVICHAPYGAAAAWIGEDKLNEIARHIRPLALGSWRWAGPMRFYGSDGAFMYAGANGTIEEQQGYSVWIGAKTERPLQFLKPLLDDHWEYVAL